MKLGGREEREERGLTNGSREHVNNNFLDLHQLFRIVILFPIFPTIFTAPTRRRSQVLSNKEEGGDGQQVTEYFFGSSIFGVGGADEHK